MQFVRPSVKTTLKARAAEAAKQTGAQLARATALAGDASVMRSQAGGLERGDGEALVHIKITCSSFVFLMLQF